ncbi:MAG: hypothetical protein ACOX2F_12685 [bacterium]
MKTESKIRVKNKELFQVRSSNDAFIASKVTENWSPVSELYRGVASVMSKSNFDAIIDAFVLQGAVELKSHAFTKMEVNNGKDFRNYGSIKFDKVELSEAPGLPKNLKKEILFLFYYGRSISYYRFFNIVEPNGATQEKIIERCNYYRQLFALRNFEDIELGNYRSKLTKIWEFIRISSQIEDPEIREKYDYMLSVASGSGNRESEDRVNSDTRSSADRASQRFASALNFLKADKIQQAYDEIQIAVYLDPDNEEFADFKNEIAGKLKEMRVSDLYKEFEKNDFLLLDESKLEKVIDNILELTDNSPLAHLKLAEIALEKEMPEMAMLHAGKAIASFS